MFVLGGLVASLFFNMASVQRTFACCLLAVILVAQLLWPPTCLAITVAYTYVLGRVWYHRGWRHSITRGYSLAAGCLLAGLYLRQAGGIDDASLRLAGWWVFLVTMPTVPVPLATCLFLSHLWAPLPATTEVAVLAAVPLITGPGSGEYSAGNRLIFGVHVVNAAMTYIFNGNPIATGWDYFATYSTLSMFLSLGWHA